MPTHLPKYAELGSAHRNDPCQEYPGMYYIYQNGQDLACVHGRCGETAARQLYRECVQAATEDHTFAIAWGCDDNDPRVGKTWFTGYYILEKCRAWS